MMLGVCLKYTQHNYGSKLQALATVKMFEKYNLDYEIIRYNKKTFSFLLKSIPRLFNTVFLHDRYEEWQKKIVSLKHPEIKKQIEIRDIAFNSFDSNFNDHLSEVYKSYDNLKKKCKMKYSAVITCSDQLWSPSALASGFYNLMFVPKDVYKCSWASSFGVKEIPKNQIKKTIEYLTRINDISMRENTGAKIVKELINRDVPVVMDPVFAFTQSEWNELVPIEENKYGDYIFCYFLGNNAKHREKANELSRKLGIKILTFRHMDRFIENDENFGDIAPYDVNPNEFLNIIRNSKYIMTDSFHGAAFSIIYQKKFLVFNRYSDESKNSKNTRIDSLCEILNLSKRRYSSSNDICDSMNESIEYDKVALILNNYKYITNEYLERVFDTCKKFS